MLGYHYKGVVRSLVSKRGVKDPVTVSIQCEGWKGQMPFRGRVGGAGGERPRAVKGRGACREMANRKQCDRAGKARWCQFRGGT